MVRSITKLQYACGYKPRPLGVGTEDSVLMAADKARGAAPDPQMRIEGSGGKPNRAKTRKTSRPQAMSVSSPFTSFIKMVDFR